MKQIRYTLISDGNSDSTLLEVIKWLFNDLYPLISANGQHCRFDHLPNPPQNSDVVGGVNAAKYLTPFDICFYHRDAEDVDIKSIVKKRTSEIRNGLSDDVQNIIVCLVPVKMMESWLLIDRNAIKAAAGNLHFNGNLTLPKLTDIEKHKTPKDTLHDLLKQATGNSGRRLKNFNVNQAVHRVAEYIEDYSPLRQLKAFQLFESEMKRAVDRFLNRNQMGE